MEIWTFLILKAFMTDMITAQTAATALIKDVIVAIVSGTT